ncbi:uncharacterized protein [Arachis hypogaea]|uniref:uncharacterized protein n=1 Tax=Arachis hypogaea TaxID=3818 RepID=UPI0010FC4C44|nr:uncharacterized protein LOC114924966 [Arachis hypogaea]
MEPRTNSSFSSVDIQALPALVNQINAMNQSNASRAQTNPALDPVSPYFLHLGENPGSAIVTVTLVGNNFQNWERDMWRALKSKNKIKFVDGSIKRPPEDDALFEAWDHCNTHIVSWINHSLSPEITQSIMWIDSAEKLWKELGHRYSNGDVYRIAELEEELFATKQGDASVTAYYTKLKSIWEELENLRPILSCSRCPEKCNCELSIMRGYKEESGTVRFLRGLNEQFSTARSQIMLSKPLPKVDAVFASLLQ